MSDFQQDVFALGESIQPVLYGHSQAVILAALLTLAAAVIQTNPHEQPEDVQEFLARIRQFVGHLASAVDELASMHES